ncbi:hypothetical protein ABZX40_30890 [Streptomyces sp. NPDC004610]|uniref:hypothetical protein n=1 Tax=unclassified Streptomyces TaxID=2593676 RepID=UPI0033B5FB7E
MTCKTGNPVIDAILGFFSFLGDPIGTILSTIADFVLFAAVQVYGAIITGIPTLESMTTSQQVSGQTRWLVVYLAVGSLLFAAAKMAVERKGNAGITALKGILRVVLVSTAATTIVGAAVVLSDSYATHLFNAGAEAQLKQIGGCSDIGGVGAFVKLILAFLLLIAGILQTILLYIRMGVMIVLLGTLPVAAAASMTDWGAGWWRKHIGWLIAWLLYKPAAGLILYAGSVMTGAGKGVQGEADGTIHTRIAGIAVMLLSAVALPALLKLIVPATAALGGANPGGEAVGVAGGLASGAIQLAGRGSGGGASGGAGGLGKAGPSGASATGGGSSGAGGASGGGGVQGPGGRNGQSGGSGSGGGNGSGGSSGGGSSGDRGGPSGAGRAGGASGGGGGGGGGGAAAGAGRAASVAGPAGAAAAAAGAVLAAGTQAVAQGATQAVEGDGNLGHNT